MRRIYSITTVTFVLSALIFAHNQASTRPAQTPQTRLTTEAIKVEKALSTQQRINRYFHGGIMSKLQRCWSSVKGKGRITLKYTYTKSDTRWVFNRLQTDESTLPSGQDAIAIKCMSDAVRGSSFSVDIVENTQNTFVLNWTWPVPLPGNATQLTTAMFAAKPGTMTTGGCDGFGTPAKCYTCGPETCDKVCVGWTQCSVFSNGSCIATGEACASGGPFGVIGSRVMF